MRRTAIEVNVDHCLAGGPNSGRLFSPQQVAESHRPGRKRPGEQEVATRKSVAATVRPVRIRPHGATSRDHMPEVNPSDIKVSECVPGFNLNLTVRRTLSI